MTKSADGAFEHLPLAAAIVEVWEAGAPAVVMANRALSELTGYEPEELAGRWLADLVVGVHHMAGLLAGESGTHGVEAVCLTAEDRHIAVTMHAASLPARAGSLPRAIVQIQQGTPRQDAAQARKREKRLEDMADNVAALIYLKHTDGRYIFINRHYAQQFGVRREEVQSKTDFDLWPEHIAAIYTANDRRVLATRAPMKFEEPIGEGGDWATWLSLKFPLFDADGTLYGVGGISTDISDRSRAEAAIREARDEAERANRAKSEFLSRMSHELRTPLNSILGFGQLLQMERLDAGTADGVDHIVHAGRHLLTLINEVLEISRIESGGQALSVEPVHACDPLNEAFELVRPLAAERGIELARDLHGGLYRFVLADFQRLKQVLLNILTNAVKYNRDGGKVTVTVTLTAAGDALRFRFIDSGPGIDEDAVDKLFVPFERLGADKTHVEGTGLGLALSKSLIEAMGGTIGVERTAPGEGSVFFVELPVTDAPREPADLVRQDEALADLADLRSLTILYVEDNLFNFELVQRVLRRAGDPHLIPAMQGQIGLELAAQHRPDVILLDLDLPDIDGEEVLQRLVEEERTCEIPVIVLSADAMPAQIERLKAVGAVGYVTKPLEIPAFLDAVRGAVGRSGA